MYLSFYSRILHTEEIRIKANPLYHCKVKVEVEVKDSTINFDN